MTITQKQCLLAYLGYYTIEIDGLWGDCSTAATKNFQSDYGLDSDGIFGVLTEKRILEVIASGEKPGVDWSKVEYFTRDEFKCKCGGKYCNGFPAEPDRTMVTVADRVRKHFNSAAIVSSGVRCEFHNASVGGVTNSRHLTGKAMDFCVVGKTAGEVLEYVWQQPEVRYAYNIDGTYVHMDFY